MYWTNTLKTLCNLVLILGIAVSVICGIWLISSGEETAILGLIVLVGGVLVSVASVALSLMLCEMSNNLNEINSKLTHISIDSSKSDSPLAKLARENAPAPVKTHGSTWVCPECDKVNPNAKRVCMDCGYER